MKKLAVILLLLAGCSDPPVKQEPVETELANVRAMILAERPDLAEADDLTKALALRDMVYRMVPLKVAGDFDYTNLDGTVRKALFDDAYGQICGGLAITYMTALKAFGIDARYVGMFREVSDAPAAVDSHASVGAFIDGRWIALDPTYNVSIRSGGRQLSCREYRRALDTGAVIAFDSDGLGFLPGRVRIEDYPVPLSAIAAFMILGPSERSGAATIPASWSGVLHYASGAEFDQAAALRAPPYSALSRPVEIAMPTPLP